jgi:hypothetical protein
MKDLEGTEFETPGLNAVCYDGFEGCEEGAKEGEDETEGRKVVVACRSETDPCYDLGDVLGWCGERGERSRT